MLVTQQLSGLIVMQSQVTSTARAVSAPSSHTIVIVGAGFSGTVLASRLLRTVTTPTQIILVEQGSEIGRGIAYAKRDYPYLLNVPASRMSADARDPLQFVRFAKRRDPAVEGEHFLPREVYGDYLAACLLSAKRGAPSCVSMRSITAQALRITPRRDSKQLCVELSNGIDLLADDVVLATGNPLPANLPCDASVHCHPAYFDNPWSLNTDYSPWQKVLIVGTGLSMADAVMQMQSGVHGVPQLQAISRHGLLPLPQTVFRTPVLRGVDTLLLSETYSLRKLTRAVISLARAIEDAGDDWREAIVFLRALTPTIWSALAASERRRFLRHVQPYWDIHRHRLPACVAENLAKLRHNGKLRVNAGRIESMQAAGDQIKVVWRARGETTSQTCTVDGVINATGPDYRLSETRDVLLRSLVESRLITADPRSLGLRTDGHYAVIDANNQSQPHLFYLGPMLRAEHWEATAVPELRDHAERLATLLVERHLRWATQ
jgi:uncharacterized NAD(P)/FAD-binding protein YdhS